jgi:pimeloyl-ACP methyl ester carboxylesterase
MRGKILGWWLASALAANIAFIGNVSAQPEPTPEPAWYVDEAALPFTALPDATAYYGIHKAAGYRIEVPNNWNGELVMFAHGHRGDGLALIVDNPTIREHLIATGFAWAASSFASNGYDPEQGAKDTYALARLFDRRVRKPKRTYMFGGSMGGHVTAVAIERWPRAFDGALPICGNMGDNELFDYFQDAYLVGETLIGHTPQLPQPADWPTNGLPLLRTSLGPQYPVVRPIFEQSWTGPPSFPGGELILSGLTVPGAENLFTVYQFDDDPALSSEEEAFNDQIVRVAPDRRYRTRHGLMWGSGSSPRIRGRINIPVLSLHTLGDLFVPFSMEQVYARRVAMHGKSGLLVQRAIRDMNHCGFTIEEQTRAFDDLVKWVKYGVRPAGDDVLDPAVVAAPNYGCRFTEGLSPLRIALPTCP